MTDKSAQSGSAVISEQYANAVEKKVVDIHVHIFGYGESDAGLRTSTEMIEDRGVSGMLSALGLTHLEAGEETIRERVLNAINTSRKIDCAVLLAIDGVYRNGRHVGAESHLFVSNDYVMQIAKAEGRILFGASVHPYREAGEMLYETKTLARPGKDLSDLSKKTWASLSDFLFHNLGFQFFIPVSLHSRPSSGPRPLSLRPSS